MILIYITAVDSISIETSLIDLGRILEWIEDPSRDRARGESGNGCSGLTQ